MHRENQFITLTYSPEHLPNPLASLEYRDFQLFMKRYRKWINEHCGENQECRFYMCGEYGENFGRPHFHAVIFGHRFPDLVPWRRSGSGEVIFRSRVLESLWPFGFSSVGEVTFESAAYVARYVMKKQTGDLAKAHYTVIDADGVITERCPEFNKMSLKPGIGAKWYERFAADVHAIDGVVVRGKKTRVPRYYDRLYSRENPDAFEAVKEQREFDAIAFRGDNTPQRLEAKEQVVQARSSLLKREL